MTPQREEFLKKARAAEEHAIAAKTDALRNSWLKIAASYREMASPKSLG